MKTGDKVIIRRSKYKEPLVGLTGTICDYYMGQYKVRVDGHFNMRSINGVYYFKETQLEQFTEGEQNKMEGKYRIALVKFLEGSNTDRKYAYACYDKDIAEGDVCVVKTANHGFGIAKISEFVLTWPEDITREIVAKVDFSNYNARVAARKKRAELKVEMKKRASQLQEIALYSMLAESDPAMQELLKEYQDLSDGN